MSSYSDYARNVGDLMTRKAGARADATATKGQIWGNTLGSIGQMVAGFPQQMRQAQQSRFQAQKQQQEQEAALAIKDLFKRHGGQITPEFIADLRTLDPQAAFDVEQKLLTAQKTSMELQDAFQRGLMTRQQGLDKIFAAVDPKDGGSWFQAIETAKLTYPDLDLKSYGTTPNPSVISAARRRLMTAEQLHAADNPPPPEPFTLNEGDTRYSGTGAVIASVPKAEPIPQGFTLNEGDTRYDAKGNVIASVPSRPPAASTDKIWVRRNGNAVYVGKNEVQPGDVPYEPGTSPDGGVKLSAGQQQEMETMLTLSDLATTVLTLGDKIGWKGVGALGTGSVAQFGSRLGYGTDEERSLRNNISNIQASIAKLRGGTSFTETEQALLERYTPTINDGDADIKQKLTDLKAFIETKRKNTIRVAGGDLSATPAGGGSEFSVTAPNGKTYTFPTRQALEQFKARAGIR